MSDFLPMVHDRSANEEAHEVQDDDLHRQPHSRVEFSPYHSMQGSPQYLQVRDVDSR